MENGKPRLTRKKALRAATALRLSFVSYHHIIGNVTNGLFFPDMCGSYKKYDEKRNSARESDKVYRIPGLIK